MDHLHNGDRFKYSFTCILISLLGLIQVQRFYSITDTETRPRSLIKMHIKLYLNRSPLCKWSINRQFINIYIIANISQKFKHFLTFNCIYVLFVITFIFSGGLMQLFSKLKQLCSWELQLNFVSSK